MALRQRLHAAVSFDDGARLGGGFRSRTDDPLGLRIHWLGLGDARRPRRASDRDDDHPAAEPPHLAMVTRTRTYKSHQRRRRERSAEALRCETGHRQRAVFGLSASTRHRAEAVTRRSRQAVVGQRQAVVARRPAIGRTALRHEAILRRDRALRVAAREHAGGPRVHGARRRRRPPAIARAVAVIGAGARSRRAGASHTSGARPSLPLQSSPCLRRARRPRRRGDPRPPACARRRPPVKSTWQGLIAVIEDPYLDIQNNRT
jgi:hypothetical protein